MGDGHRFVARLVAAIHPFAFHLGGDAGTIIGPKRVLHPQAGERQDAALTALPFLACLVDDVGGHKHTMLGKHRIERVVNIVNAAILEALLSVFFVLSDGIHLREYFCHRAINLRLRLCHHFTSLMRREPFLVRFTCTPDP